MWWLRRASSAAGAYLHFDLDFDLLANLKLAIGGLYVTYNDVGCWFECLASIFESCLENVSALGRFIKESDDSFGHLIWE